MPVAHGQSVQAADVALRRCPACGHPLDQFAVSQCPLCGFALGDPRATCDDATPYALAYERGAPGWRAMSEWVWFAGSERLKHLALMRTSVASRHFARMNTLLLAVGIGQLEAMRVGWRWVSNSPTIEPTGSTLPRGHFWVHLAATPRALLNDVAQERPVDLWWNPVQTLVAAAAAALLAIVLLWVVAALIRAGVTLVHRAKYREEQRMTAAVDYGTAWAIPIFVATMVLSFLPLSYVGGIQRWAWCPTEAGFEVSSGVVAGLGAALWWFWLVRLAITAPPKTRATVIAFFALGAPLIVVAAAGTWWVLLRQSIPPLFNVLHLSF